MKDLKNDENYKKIMNDGSLADVKEKRGSDNGSKKKKLSPAAEWILVIAIALAVALFINFFIIINSTVPTGSMKNTIMPGDRILGLRITYIFEEPKRGDIVVFKYPDDPSIIFVKRIIGIGGDKVEIKKGVTYVNDEIIDEPYLREKPYENDYGPYYVPEDAFFCMGDNRNDSLDGRYWTSTNFVPRKNILGKAMFCYWPFSHMGTLKGAE